MFEHYHLVFLEMHVTGEYVWCCNKGNSIKLYGPQTNSMELGPTGKATCLLPDRLCDCLCELNSFLTIRL
jgi:hypothetical protein